jgi:hypothetical protein
VPATILAGEDDRDFPRLLVPPPTGACLTVLGAYNGAEAPAIAECDRPGLIVVCRTIPHPILTHRVSHGVRTPRCRRSAAPGAFPLLLSSAADHAPPSRTGDTRCDSGASANRAPVGDRRSVGPEGP